MLEILQFIVCAVLIIAGLFTAITATFGTYRLKSAMNRMHSAALGDTLGISLVLLGLIVANGISFESMKLVLILVFLWFASPVSSHLLARLELTIDKEVKEDCEVIRR